MFGHLSIINGDHNCPYCWNPTYIPSDLYGLSSYDAKKVFHYKKPLKYNMNHLTDCYGHCAHFQSTRVPSHLTGALFLLFFQWLWSPIRHIKTVKNNIISLRCGIVFRMNYGETLSFNCKGMEGRYITIVIPDQLQFLSLCEVQVFGELSETPQEGM